MNASSLFCMGRAHGWQVEIEIGPDEINDGGKVSQRAKAA